MTNRVAVNLIVGAKGETTWGGTSAGLSFAADRARFHQLRREFQAILIGGNTAHNEPYAKTPLPLIVLTHRPLPEHLVKNPFAQAWELPLSEAISRAVNTYGDLLIEAGPVLINDAISQGLITEIYLSISQLPGGENPIDIRRLTENGVEISRQEVDGGLFLHYRLAPSHL